MSLVTDLTAQVMAGQTDLTDVRATARLLAAAAIDFGGTEPVLQKLADMEPEAERRAEAEGFVRQADETKREYLRALQHGPPRQGAAAA